MQVVVFVGYKSSGKSTCAKILTSMDAKVATPDAPVGATDGGVGRYREFAFAAGVKDVAHAVFPDTDREDWEGATPASREWREREYRYGMTPRKILQLIGTEMFRDMISPDVWVNRTIDEVRSHLTMTYASGYPGGAVIADCRFLNEMRLVRATFGSNATFIFVHRPSISRTDDHKSEAEIEMCRASCDCEIVNDGSVDDLRRELIRILSSTWTEKKK